MSVKCYSSVWFGVWRVSFHLAWMSKCCLTVAVADPGLQIRGGPVIQTLRYGGGGGGRPPDAGLQKKVFQQCHTLKFYPEPIRLLALYKSGRSWAPWKACPRLPHPQTFPGLSGDWGTRAHDKPSEISEKCAREMTGMTGDKAVSKAFRKWKQHKVYLLRIWWKILAHKWA